MSAPSLPVCADALVSFRRRWCSPPHLFFRHTTGNLYETEPCVNGSLPAMKIIFKSLADADQFNCHNEVWITWPQYSLPPFVQARRVSPKSNPNHSWNRSPCVCNLRWRQSIVTIFIQSNLDIGLCCHRHTWQPELVHNFPELRFRLFNQTVHAVARVEQQRQLNVLVFAGSASFTGWNDIDNR